MRNAGRCGGLRSESGRAAACVRFPAGAAACARNPAGAAACVRIPAGVAAFRGMPGAEKGKTRIRNRSKINIVHGACACYTNARKLLPYCVAAVIFPHCAAEKSEQPFKGEKEKK